MLSKCHTKEELRALFSQQKDKGPKQGGSLLRVVSGLTIPGGD